MVGGLPRDRGHTVSDDGDGSDFPANQFLAPELVMTEMAEVGAERAMNRTASEVLVLSVLAGGFITIGALFSTLIATGTDNEGVVRLLEGFGFSVGFFLVVLTGTLLFTEVNVEMPATLFGSGWRALGPRVARLWLLAAVGNMIGAFVAGLAISAAENFTPGSGSCWPRSSMPRCATARSVASRAGSRRCCPACSATGWSAWPRSSR